MRVDDTDVQITYCFLNCLHVTKKYVGFTERKKTEKCIKILKGSESTEKQKLLETGDALKERPAEKWLRSYKSSTNKSTVKTTFIISPLGSFLLSLSSSCSLTLLCHLSAVYYVSLLLSVFPHFSILYISVYKSICMCLRKVKSDWWCTHIHIYRFYYEEVQWSLSHLQAASPLHWLLLSLSLFHTLRQRQVPQRGQVNDFQKVIFAPLLPD